MVIDRRTFILSTPLVATVPVFATLLSLSPTVPLRSSALPGLSPLQLTTDKTDTNCELFRIDGWDRCDASATAGSTTAASDRAILDPTEGPVLIRINRSWRAAWR
jgi:hypothetical protein